MTKGQICSGGCVCFGRDDTHHTTEPHPSDQPVRRRLRARHAEAEAFFDEELRRTKTAFGRGGTGKFSIEDVPVADQSGSELLRRAEVRTIKRNGQPGANRFRLHLYAIK